MLPMVKSLADEFDTFLFNSDFTKRFTHHFANVANETWLSLEMAFLFNSNRDKIGASGWSAVLEQQLVDVTLLPPPVGSSDEQYTSPVYIELKLVGTNWWNSNWRDVAKDLFGTPDRKHIRNKPLATYSVCLVYNNLKSEGTAKRRPATTKRFQGFMDSLPAQSGCFEPGVDDLKFYMERSSRLHRLRWEQPVGNRWPHGFEADARVIWLSRGPK